jgi:hypothetical protein
MKNALFIRDIKRDPCPKENDLLKEIGFTEAGRRFNALPIG